MSNTVKRGRPSKKVVNNPTQSVVVKTVKFFTMLDFFINTGVDFFWYGLGFYGGYKLGLINGGIKQLELIDKEFNENFKETA